MKTDLPGASPVAQPVGRPVPELADLGPQLTPEQRARLISSGPNAGRVRHHERMQMGQTDQPAKVNAWCGPLPPQREGQYQTMTICGTSDDPAERGHWSSPAHVQWRIDKAVAEERERWKKEQEK